MLQHPHVVPVHSVQRDHDRSLTAVCMPYLSRVSMFDVMDVLFSVPDDTACLERPDGNTLDAADRSKGSKGSRSRLTERGAAVGQRPRWAGELLEAVRRLNGAVAAQPDAAVDVPWPRHWRFADAVLQIGVQLAQALEHAHQQGVLHGDVKPSNILITNSGRAVLLDFNLAIFGAQSGPFVAGTLPYMAPEQLRGVLVRGKPADRSVDVRTDIFSLGLTLFELLYGESAFGPLPSENSRELIAGRLLERHAQGPNLPKGRAGDSTRRIGEIIIRCLAFDPAQRPQTMEEVATLLAAEMKPARRVARWLRAHRRLTLATASLICAGALALGGWQMSRDPYPIREWKLAEADYDLGDDAAAVAHATEALRADPKLVEAKLLRGIAYSRQKDLVAARADLDPLSDQVPDGRAAAALAHAFWSAEPGLAVLYYQRAISQGYRTPTLYNNLGYCLYQVGRLDDSAVALETAITLDPLLGTAHHNLASLELRNARRRRPPDTASLEAALRLAPQSLELDLEAAWIYAGRVPFADEASRQVEVDNVFRYLHDALGRGMARQNLDDLARSHPNLKADDRWSFLEARVQPGSTNKPTTLLIDPIPEIRTRTSSRAGEPARR
jgi:tetratricopeptide (TPR) repeat protein